MIQLPPLLLMDGILVSVSGLVFLVGGIITQLPFGAFWLP